MRSRSGRRRWASSESMARDTVQVCGSRLRRLRSASTPSFSATSVARYPPPFPPLSPRPVPRPPVHLDSALADGLSPQHVGCKLCSAGDSIQPCCCCSHAVAGTEHTPADMATVTSAAVVDCKLTSLFSGAHRFCFLGTPGSFVFRRAARDEAPGGRHLEVQGLQQGAGRRRLHAQVRFGTIRHILYLLLYAALLRNLLCPSQSGKPFVMLTDV